MKQLYENFKIGLYENAKKHGNKVAIGSLWMAMVITLYCFARASTAISQGHTKTGLDSTAMSKDLQDALTTGNMTKVTETISKLDYMAEHCETQADNYLSASWTQDIFAGLFFLAALFSLGISIQQTMQERKRTNYVALN